MARISNKLPFQRGTTWSEGKTAPTAAFTLGIEGNLYEVADTVHSLAGQKTVLRAVRNGSTALTVARRCVSFSTLGRVVTDLTPSAGDPTKPIDDAYVVGATIPAYDYFYLVEEGPCDIQESTSSSSLAVGTLVQVTVDGKQGTAVADGKYPIGRKEEADSTGLLATRVYVGGTFGVEGS